MTPEETGSESFNEILLELRKLNATLKAAFSIQITTRIQEIATTEDRRRIWASVDGTKDTKALVTQLHIPRRTIDDFLAKCETAGLILNPRGQPPLRLVDHVPVGWAAAKKVTQEGKEHG